MNKYTEHIIKESIKDINRFTPILKDHHEGYAKGTAYTLWQMDIITEKQLDFILELIKREYYKERRK